MLPDLVVELVRRGKATCEAGASILGTIRSRYHVGGIEHRLGHLQEVKEHGDSTAVQEESLQAHET
jgi:hypothetical protein